MNVNGISGSNAEAQSFQMNRNQGTDSVSKNLQNQIAMAQKELQELSGKKEMPPEEKMKKRQELQKQISDLQNQLRKHQMELRKESQQKKGSSMETMSGGSKQASKSAKDGTGLSSTDMQHLSQATMFAFISADSSMKQVKAQGAVKSQMESKARILKSEIKQDTGRGGNARKKQEELAAIEEKTQEIELNQINFLSDIDKKLKETSETDQQTVPDNVVVDSSEPVGSNVDVKL